uniref:Serine/threonine-protein kinase TOR n=1 Tax=Trypanosoma vivax (strain Y486) TaxID=1055687 RepID=G0TTR7_TRYVY|nr:putative phosphatidylinositol 3-kinase tor, fragment [Trypanosoma vivax Y486]
MSLVYDAQRLITIIRSTAGGSEGTVTYSQEVVKLAKESQRKNQHEYECMVSCLLFCLENFDLIGGNPLEIKCALVVLATLLQLDLTANQISQCNSYLSICLDAVNDVPLAVTASRTFGETLVNSMTSDFVQSRIDVAFSSFDMKEPDMQVRRICGLLVLQEVVTRTPMRILDVLDSLLEKLWGVLASPDELLRNISLQLFNDCGKLLSSRSASHRIKTVDLLLHQLKSNLAAKSREANMAGLLAFETVIMTSMGTASQPPYENVSIMMVPYVMTGGSSNFPDLIRKLLFRCLVVLCRYSTTLFIANQLKDTVSFALKCIQNFYQHGAAFDMLSEIIPMVCMKAYSPFVKDTCEAVRYVSEKSPTPSWESLRCFAVVSRVCRPIDIESYIEPCIQNIFNWGLSLQLIESMRSIIALDALVQFGFTNSELMGDFLRDSVLPLIDSESTSVRNAAIRTICTLLIPAGVNGELTMARRICVDIIVSRMLVVGLSNPDPVVRKTILSSFTPPFYPYLSEVQFLTSFYAALGDEDIHCRVAATELLCRMIRHDPSHILPIFRKEIVQILHIISTSDNISAIQNGLQLLDAVAYNAPQFVMNFADGIIKALGPHFSSTNHTSPILQPLLRCCTSVANAAHFFGTSDVIFTVEVGRACELLDSLPLDAEFVDSRLWCLKFLCATLGPKVSGSPPYAVYPNLYNQLSGIMRNSDEDLNVRLEALRCAGFIGALDIGTFQSMMASRDSKQKEREPDEPRVLSHVMCCRVVLTAIASLLDLNEKRLTGSKPSLLLMGVQTILSIAESCACSRGEMDIVVEPVVRAASELSSVHFVENVLHMLKYILKYVGAAALSHVGILYEFIDNVWKKSERHRFLAVRLASTVASFESDGQGGSRRGSMRVPPIKFDALNETNSSEHLRYAIIEYILERTHTLQACTETVVTNLLRATQKNSIGFIVPLVTTLRVVCWRLHVDEFAGQIVRGLLACLRTHLPTVAGKADQNLFTNRVVSVFCVLVTQLQGEFVKYAPEVVRTLKTLRVTNHEFAPLHGMLMKGMRCALSESSLAEYKKQEEQLLATCETMALSGISELGRNWSTAPNAEEVSASVCDSERPLPFSEKRIIESTKTDPLTKEEWIRWIDHFSITIMQESPYRVFRCVSLPSSTSVSPLVECSRHFTETIVPHAFRALWSFASASVRESIADFMSRTFRQTMDSPAVPDEVITTLLSLAEYMENMDMTLPIAPRILFECAWSRGMLAKALYWCEATYRKDHKDTAKPLFQLYRELQQSGLLMLTGYTESLQLTKHEIDMELNAVPGNVDNPSKRLYRGKTLRRMCAVGSRTRSDVNSSSIGDDAKLDPQMEKEINTVLSLAEVGDYDKVLGKWCEMYEQYGNKGVEKKGDDVLFYVSQCAADAAIRLQSWNILEDTLSWLLTDSVQYYISYAAMSIHKAQYDEALSAINEGRKLLLGDLSGLLHESYTRAYEGFVIAQKLSELEEVVAAKKAEVTSSTKHLQRILRLWDQRIEMMSPTVPAWKQVLSVRGLLIPPTKDVTTRLRFVKLCRRENAKQLERFTLCQLLGQSRPTYEHLMSCSANPRVVMQYISFLAANNELGVKSPYGLESDMLKKIIDTHSKAENALLLASAYVRLGANADLKESVECYKAATLYYPKWSHAWRMYAEANAESLDVEFSDCACAAAIEGYIKSITLGNLDSTVIQDVLKLLTLLNRHCDREAGLKELHKRVPDVPPRAWSLVVPQLIALLDSGSESSCQLVADILTAVAFNYPHSLIYPLNLCTMSDSERRKKYASAILEKLQGKFPLVVSQGLIVVDELLRISDLLHEQWYDKLESSATAFFDRQDYKGMVSLLMPLHEKIRRPPDTIVEAEFTCKYGRSLNEAQDWLLSFLQTGSVADLHSAWNIYYKVYRQIDDHIRSQTKLHLPFCSPKLFEARNLTVGLPDAMPTDDSVVSCTASFHDMLHVIPSKQRPKRLGVTTVDGRTQKYLLKGREDLRLDERVMQLFRLVNTLMMTDSRTCKNPSFQIQRYSVTPLKDTVGLIGWVSGCDTLHTLVTKYRELRGIPPELELRMMNQIILCEKPKAYDCLTIMSKVEVVEFLADHTSGHDVRKAMWASASNCETWLERRQAFTTSLATTSVVGYILGLGDRHPNNVMIQRTSGLFVHIDFGDCFEVAMTRDMFPEKVPFRLTRMLRNALDVFGVNGPFRTIAEVAMCVLRDGSRSVLAILEAFIQDPIISWRLVNHPGKEPRQSVTHAAMDDQVSVANPQPTRLAFPGAPKRSEASVVDSRHAKGEALCKEEMVHKGVVIFHRVRSKLKGEEFLLTEGHRMSMDAKVQVTRLIMEATDITNVAQSWTGWYPFW